MGTNIVLQTTQSSLNPLCTDWFHYFFALMQDITKQCSVTKTKVKDIFFYCVFIAKQHVAQLHTKSSQFQDDDVETNLYLSEIKLFPHYCKSLDD